MVRAMHDMRIRMASNQIKELARTEPEAFRRVANMRDDKLREHMLAVLQETEHEQDRQLATA